MYNMVSSKTEGPPCKHKKIKNHLWKSYIRIKDFTSNSGETAKQP